jgi:hypothetical protein
MPTLSQDRFVLSRIAALGLALVAVTATAEAPAAQKKAKKVEVTYPPALPDGKTNVTDKSDVFLKPPATLRKDVKIAREAPTVDFAYFPGQDYAGKPWSAWGDSLAANGKYYTSIGDHLAPAGNAFVYEYDPQTKAFKRLADVKKLLELPEGHYVPGKIHSRLDLASDGWLYFGTHRGSTKVTANQFHYKGDWIIRCNPETRKSEVVVCGPVLKHCIPASVVDAKRMIFYGATAPGTDAENQSIHFFAYDLKNRKLLYSGPDGPARCMILAPSTGRVYYMVGTGDDGPLMRYDPEKGGAPVKIEGTLGIRAASEETPQGIVYTVSQGRKGAEATVFAFNTKTEKAEELGPAAAGKSEYITSVDVDPTGRYLYYIAGAHGGADEDGAPIVQFDVKTKKRKVIAFLHPFYKEKYGCTLRGTYSSALDAKGEKLFITWNAARVPGKAWDCCTLTVVHIPASERK